MGGYAQLFWMVPLAALLFYLLKKQAIKASRDKHTRKIIKQRLAHILEERLSWRGVVGNAGEDLEPGDAVALGDDDKYYKARKAAP